MEGYFEITAWCRKPKRVVELLEDEQAEHRGFSNQTDTFFLSNSGYLQLREENGIGKLIYFEDDTAAQQGKSLSYEPQPGSDLKEMLIRTMGKQCVVDKQREIYSIENVQFYLDEVKGLGSFVKIKAFNRDQSMPLEKLQEQCNHYVKALELNAKDIVSKSYKELLQENSLFTQVYIQEDKKEYQSF